MLRRRQHPEALSVETGKPDERSITFAWKTHSAITDWTAKVDYKAAIVLSLGGVLLGFFATLSGSNRPLAHIHGWQLIVERLGLGWSALGVFFAGFVVTPRLNRRLTKSNWRENYVYFGHLRYWRSADLKEKLRSLDAEQELGMLATQLIATSKIAWYKHSLLQSSMFCLAIGVVLVAISAVKS